VKDKKRNSAKEAKMNEKTYYDVYTVIEREEGKNLWLKIGVAFENRDGSLNCTLNALPVNGKLHIREHVEYEQEERPQAKPAQKPQPSKKQSSRKDYGQKPSDDDYSPF
jgi:hypothetical protein